MNTIGVGDPYEPEEEIPMKKSRIKELEMAAKTLSYLLDPATTEDQAIEVLKACRVEVAKQRSEALDFILGTKVDLNIVN